MPVRPTIIKAKQEAPWSFSSVGSVLNMWACEPRWGW
jgi:hypothetical protein